MLISCPPDQSSTDVPDKEVSDDAKKNGEWDQIGREMNGEGTGPTATLIGAEDEVSQGCVAESEHGVPL